MCVLLIIMLLWPPYVIGQAVIFLPFFFLLLMVALCNRADHYIGSRPGDHYFRSVCLSVSLCRVFLSRL